MTRSMLAIALLLAWTSGAAAQALAALPGTGSPAASDDARTRTCELIDSAAAAHGLPADYFARLIWTESRFRPEAVSPKGAQGIAQFMPATAAERGLADPFDPGQAIPASAKLLKHLAERFGNLGLAAAAYNSGARRVEDWLAGAGGLPLETRNYVAAITGRPVEHWRTETAVGAPVPPGPEDQPTTCLDVVAGLALPATATATPVAAPEASAAWQPWGVQLAGSFSQSRALASYRSLQKLHPQVLGGREPLILNRTNPGMGRRPMVNIRVPAPTREAANDLCHKLRARGAACAVLKN